MIVLPAIGEGGGAFTGIVRDHVGLSKRADGSTVFLDEVAELPVDLQAKLLRALQERSFIALGGDRAVSVDGQYRRGGRTGHYANRCRRSDSRGTSCTDGG